MSLIDEITAADLKTVGRRFVKCSPRCQTQRMVCKVAGRAELRNSTTVFPVGNIESIMECYKRLGLHSRYYPPGCAILRRDDVQIFLQQPD